MKLKKIFIHKQQENKFCICISIQFRMFHITILQIITNLNR